MEKKRSYAPLRRLTAANQAVAAGRQKGRMIAVEDMPAHELGDVMRSRNEMLRQLEATDTALRRRLRELSVLNSTAALLSEPLDTNLDSVLEKILAKVLALSDMEAGEVCLYESAKGRLTVRAQRGFPPEWLDSRRHRPLSCLCGRAMRQQGPICIPDIRTVQDGTCSACKRTGFRGYCAIPLRAEGETLGVLTLRGQQACQNVDQKLDLLAAIGNQISIALMNVHLYTETQRLARTDPLTGLANRRTFERRLEEEIVRVRRYEHPLSLLMADLDHFKAYNDTYGHQVGDAMLQQVAELLQGAVRETDLVARYGGEEFVILLPETPPDGVRAVAEKIRETVEEHRFLDGDGNRMEG